jgi:hypothetical protein
MKSLSNNRRFRLSILSIFFLISIAALLWLKPRLASGAESGTDAAAEQSAIAMARADAVTIHAGKRDNPFLNLKDGRSVKARYRPAGAESAAAAQELTLGQAEPVALASGDLNGDGYPDLVSGYAGSEGGVVTLHLSNPEAFGPQKQETIRAIADGQFPEPFLPNATVLRAPGAADFVGVGDFDRDGKLDVIAASRNGAELYLFTGDGSGILRGPQVLSLPGIVTALTTGDIDSTDGVADVAAAIVGNQGAAVLVYAGAQGVHSTRPVVYPLPAPATELAIGQLDDDAAQDLAAVAGSEVLILHGRVSALTRGLEEGFEEVLGRVETVRLPFAVQRLALGEFIWDRESRQEIAALSADGSVHIVARGLLDTRPFSAAEMQERRRGMVEVRAAMANGSVPRTTRAAKAMTWRVVEELPASLRAGDQSRAVLTGARISGLPADDLLIMDPVGRQLRL